MIKCSAGLRHQRGIDAPQPVPEIFLMSSEASSLMSSEASSGTTFYHTFWLLRIPLESISVRLAVPGSPIIRSDHRHHLPSQGLVEASGPGCEAVRLVAESTLTTLRTSFSILM
eukprot:765763-Hanusia_phi.AAC.1